MSNRSILKTFFETGDYPTQEQFRDLIDSLLHADDGNLISNIVEDDDMITIYLSGGGSVVINKPTSNSGPIVSDIVGSGDIDVPATSLVSHIIIKGVAGAFLVGETSGSNDIDEGDLIDNQSHSISYGRYFDVDGKIHFTGNFNAKIYIV